MAGDWIKWGKGLSRRSEVLAMASSLRTDRRVVACLCMELWEWADTETTDGHIRGANLAFVDGLVAFPGFASAIEAVGWLRSTEHGITLIRWDRHNGASAKKRLQDNDRQQRLRAKKQAAKAKAVSRDDCDILRDNNVTREEKRREEENQVESKSTAREPENAIAWNPDRGWEHISEDDAAGWALAYPACNIPLQLAQMAEWLRSNPAKAHKSNWRRFITNWLTRSQDRGGDLPRGGGMVRLTGTNGTHAAARRQQKNEGEYD